ncbi:MAG TPA: PPOX class F420-dependent oxidoreductase [Actinomycetota bacterium]|nr:PPOX class F420-dependent oxidoreductase [Actinomycetota bacterium]
MDIEAALRQIEANGLGTLGTIGTAGPPHLSVVFAAVVEGELWISSTQDRRKTKNVRANPHASFLSGTGPWAAIEGTARVDDGEDIAERLRRYYRTASGEHPDWDEYDAAMVAEKRLVIAITPVRAYGA